LGQDDHSTQVSVITCSTEYLLSSLEVEDCVQRKGKVVPVHAMKALVGGAWSTSLPSCFMPTPPRKNLGTHWTGGWVVVRACLDGFRGEKTSCPCKDWLL